MKGAERIAHVSAREVVECGRLAAQCPKLYSRQMRNFLRLSLRLLPALLLVGLLQPYAHGAVAMEHPFPPIRARCTKP